MAIPYHPTSAHPTGTVSKVGRVITLIPLFLAPLFFIKAAKTIYLSFLTPYLFMKDIIQDWLMARAVMAGELPYDPLPVLAGRFLAPFANFVVLRHPSPHPPPAALVALPLGLLTPGQAAFTWFGIELACIFGSVYLALRWLKNGDTPFWWAAGISIILIAWAPFWEGLMVGQITTLVLLLLTASWLSDRQTLKGIFLGAAMAIKFIGWPIWLFLLIRKQWRVATAAITVVFAANALSAIVMGPLAIKEYYGKIAASVENIYRFADANFSAWSVGFRLFAGASGPFKQSIEILPLFQSSKLALAASIIFVVIVLMIGIGLALRSKDQNTAWAVLLCTSAIVGPIAWIHHLVILLVPAALALWNIARSGYPPLQSAIWSVLMTLLFIPDVIWNHLASIFNINGPGTEPVTVPFSAGLFTLTPLAVTLGLMVLVYVSGRGCASYALSARDKG